MKKSLFIVCLCLALSVSTVFASNNPIPGDDVVLVEIHYITGYSGIYIFWQDKDVEFIDTQRPTSKNKIKEQGAILRDTFQRLYNEGYKVVSSFGNEEIIRFIMVKEM